MLTHFSLSLFLLLTIGLVAWLDYTSGATVRWPVVVIAVLLASTPATLCWAITKKAKYLLYPLIFIVLVLSLRSVTFSPAKPFRLFYGDIRRGMSASDVTYQLLNRFPQQGKYRVPTMISIDDNNLGYVLDQSDGRFDAETVQVEFLGGRVVAKQYFPD
jgi:hypothetical protein